MGWMSRIFAEWGLQLWAGIHIIRRKVDIASSIWNLVSIHLIRTKNPKQVICSYLDRKIVIRLRRPQVLHPIRRAHSLRDQHHRETRILIENRTLKRYVDYLFIRRYEGDGYISYSIGTRKGFIPPFLFSNPASSLLNEGALFSYKSLRTGILNL